MAKAADEDLQRDKSITRAIHALFWAATLQHKLKLFLVYIGNLTALIIIHIVIPLQIAYGIQATIQKDFEAVRHQALLVLILMTLGATVFAISTWLNHRVNVYGAAYIQRKVFANYLNKDYDFFSNRFIGALGADAVALRSAFQDYSLLFTFDVLRSTVIIFVGLGVILYKSLALGLVSLLCVLVIVVTLMYISKLRIKYRRAVSQASSELAGRIGDPLSHGPAVKSHAQEGYELSRLDKPLTKWIKAQLKIFDTSIPHTFIRHVLLAIAMAVLLVVSAKLYVDNSITIAIVALVQLYMLRVVTTTLEIGEIIKKYEYLMSDAYEPVATMLVPQLLKDPQKPMKLKKDLQSIEFDKVTYKYAEAAKDTIAVKNFSLKVNNGEKIGLVGFSGGGKTTITKLLLRFMDVSEGCIKINDIDIRSYSQADLRNVIAYVPQEPLLFHRSIKENIAYAKPNASEKQILKAAEIAHVDQFINELPEGYNSMVGERGVKLSGGQRQRVAIARALLKDAPILVLDEATSALDSKSEKYIQQALWKLIEGRTALVIAHRLSTIQHMDKIVVMDKGRIVQTGTHRELLKDKQGIYAQLWSHQSGGYLDVEAT